ncbi:unnamed protein product [Sphagnum compactum]
MYRVRPPNVLWNPEIRNVVLVDFERLEILKQAGSEIVREHGDGFYRRRSTGLRDYSETTASLILGVAVDSATRGPGCPRRSSGVCLWQVVEVAAGAFVAFVALQDVGPHRQYRRRCDRYRYLRKGGFRC